PRDGEDGPRPGAERERDPQGAEAGARRLRERRLRHGFEARRGDPQGARGDSLDSVDPSGDPPFAIAWIGIAYTGTPGTRGSCIWAGISPHGSGSDTGPLTKVQTVSARNKPWSNH